MSISEQTIFCRCETKNFFTLLFNFTLHFETFPVLKVIPSSHLTKVTFNYKPHGSNQRDGISGSNGIGAKKKQLGAFGNNRPFVDEFRYGKKV